jgi:hypothetical protein
MVYIANESIRNQAKAKTEALSYEESLKWREKIKAENDAFEKAEMKILSTSSDGSVIGQKGNRMFVGYNPQMVRSPHCNYCGSKSVSNVSNCTQCGAPVW